MIGHGEIILNRNNSFNRIISIIECDYLKSKIKNKDIETSFFNTGE